jgi:hypothetical protein
VKRKTCRLFFFFFFFFLNLELESRHSRQVELAAYITAHALFAVYTRAKASGVLVGEHRVFFALLLAICGVAPLFRDDGTKSSLVWRHLFEQ